MTRTGVCTCEVSEPGPIATHFFANWAQSGDTRIHTLDSCLYGSRQAVFQVMSFVSCLANVPRIQMHMYCTFDASKVRALAGQGLRLGETLTVVRHERGMVESHPGILNNQFVHF